MDKETQEIIDADRKMYWNLPRILASWMLLIGLIMCGLFILSLFGYITIYVPINWANDVVNGMTDCHHFFGLLLCIK